MFLIILFLGYDKIRDKAMINYFAVLCELGSTSLFFPQYLYTKISNGLQLSERYWTYCVVLVQLTYFNLCVCEV